MSNLIAHLTRRVLLPPGVRPRAPSRFETPAASAAPAELSLEQEIAPGATPRRTVAHPAAPPQPYPAAEFAPPATSVAVPARPQTAPEMPPMQAQPAARQTEPTPPRRRDPLVAEIPAPEPLSRRASETVHTREMLREIRQLAAPEPPVRPAMAAERHEVHRHVRELVRLRTQRLTTPITATSSAAAPAPKPAAGRAPAAPELAAAPAPPTVEIRIGRVEVQPPASARLPEPATDKPRRAATESLQDYLSSRTRERRERS